MYGTNALRILSQFHKPKKYNICSIKIMTADWWDYCEYCGKYSSRGYCYYCEFVNSYMQFLYIVNTMVHGRYDSYSKNYEKFIRDEENNYNDGIITNRIAVLFLF